MAISLSALIKVAETLIKLLDLYTTWNRKLFDDHVKPLYDAMSAVHTDYIVHFSKAKAAASSHVGETTTAKRVIELIDEAQTQNQALRRSTAAMARVAAAGGSRRHYPAEAEAFFGACSRYFSALDNNCEELALTPYSMLRAWIDSSEDERRTCATLAPMLENAISALTRSWDEVSVAYAKANLGLRR
jgi:hypothetical protein